MPKVIQDNREPLDPTKQYRARDGKVFRYETAEESGSGCQGWTSAPPPSSDHYGDRHPMYPEFYPMTEVDQEYPEISGAGVPFIRKPDDFPEFVVKDSGQREEYANGFVRDTEDGKEDFVRLFTDPKIHAAIVKEPRLLDFLATDGAHLVPPEMLIRWAVHMHKGAQKYGESNWRQARGLVAIARFARSFCRHSVKWLRGDRDEDHAVAIMFNVSARELTPEDE